MTIVNKKQAVSLGVRVGMVFLMAVIIVVTAAYFMLSQSFQSLLTDYIIKAVEAMTGQSVKIVENELQIGRQEALFLANSFQAPAFEEEEAEFPQLYTEGEYLRMVYVTREKSIASDGRQLDIRDREDICAGFEGQTAVYGPYFNKEKEYVVCYSTPVKQGTDIIGVLSVEKDGYRFCDLIENIHFANSGESYIINADGTDIAVSDQNHMDWVDTQYNAQMLFEEQKDEETKSIIEFEKKGLNGESGMGTYFWNHSLCYVAYQPIPSVNWVLLEGLREEDITSMTQTALFASLSKGPVLVICLFLIFLLAALIVYWIISSMKKFADMNEKLRVMASYDALTGLKNRNSYYAYIDQLFIEDSCPHSCIYIDANGLHELNNHLGHQAGDQMLKAVADALCCGFPKDEIYRIGGDEFVVLSRRQSRQEIESLAEQARQSLRSQGYEVSMGIAHREHDCDITSVINKAEEAMAQDKQRYYEENGGSRQVRALDRKLEKLIVEKQDADAFLSILAPEFKGVYFVNLNNDTVRHLYIPPYFEEYLRECENQFSRAILLYARKAVKSEYFYYFDELCDYAQLEKRMDDNEMPEFIYQKLNGEWLKVRVLKFKDYTRDQRETLWIFANTDNPRAAED